jgi:hypothetical protein
MTEKPPVTTDLVALEDHAAAVLTPEALGYSGPPPRRNDRSSQSRSVRRLEHCAPDAQRNCTPRSSNVMMFLMHANCAADEPRVAAAVRSCYASQVRVVGELLDSDEDAVRQWFGAGMLNNIVLALHLYEVDEPWARTLRGT